ncbi:translation initiation factor IF-2-like [Phyllostomus hastatus]|uniref:translation initiation factor IF-2-like n=1 Tax=Phyllostomus hastatus TaxID=9423 RepID=UPI001E680D56|nr:translation initiation factor IF-2-like [Phyllostomus hastatus]
MGREGMEKEGRWGDRDPRSELSRREKLPLSCARSVPSRAAAAVAVAVAVAGGGGGGSRVRSGQRLGLGAGGPTPPGASRPAASTALRSVGSSRHRNFHSGKRTGHERPGAGSTRMALGTRVHAALLRGAQGPARRRPHASEGRCPGRGRGQGRRPASVSRPDRKG